MKHGMDTVDPDDKIQEWIADNVHPDKALQLNHLIEAVIRKQVKMIVNDSDEIYFLQDLFLLFLFL